MIFILLCFQSKLFINRHEYIENHRKSTWPRKTQAHWKHVAVSLIPWVHNIYYFCVYKTLSPAQYPNVKWKNPTLSKAYSYKYLGDVCSTGRRNKTHQTYKMYTFFYPLFLVTWILLSHNPKSPHFSCKNCGSTRTCFKCLPALTQE